MHKNNMIAALGVLAVMLIGRTAHAAVEIVEARAELSAGASPHVEIYFLLRNTGTHELELMKAVSPVGDFVELKQRSFGADGKARVWPVAKLAVPSGDSVQLHANGRFFQISGVPADVRVGQALPLTLVFEDEAPVTLQLTLQAAPAKKGR